jgi:NlpC/P60 family putative phage cell wall peptidase
MDMPTRQDIIDAARGWIGTPYRHQASLRNAGCDCLGLVRGVWRELYGEEPETPPAYSPGWAESKGGEALALAGFRHLLHVPDKNFVAGDVLLFRWRPHLPAKHAGIAAGPPSSPSMIHAQDGHAVAEVQLSRWWRERIAFVFRFPGVH